MKFYYKKKVSQTLAVILTYVYRKNDLKSFCGHNSQEILNKLVEIGLLRVHSSKREIFYFLTEKSKGFKAIDLAKEYLWAYYNVDLHLRKNGKRFIFCFDQSLPSGKGLVEIAQAIKKCYV